MLLLRLFLAFVLSVFVAYTGFVISRHGTDFAGIFFGEIARLTWSGQFNLDFLFMLMFSAMWVAWRHRFSAGGIALSLLAFVGGTPFLCVYLLIESARCKGDVQALLLGPRSDDR